MSKSNTPWDEILIKYKESGLSQRLFCEANGLSLPEFAYRWNRKNRLKKLSSKPISIPGEVPTFEAVSFVKDEAFKAYAQALDLVIHLPNAIRCEVRGDLGQDAFISLLKAMVSVC